MEEKDVQAGTQYFAKLIKDGSYYVDKTMIIKELVNAHNTVNLITRPRRFGKSMTLSMLSSFFSCTEDHSIFDGLAIRNETELCNKHMGKYPVLLLDLSGFDTKTYKGALIELAGKIANLAYDYYPLYESGKLKPQDKALLETYMALQDVFNLPEGIEPFEALLWNAPASICRILHDYYGKNVIVLIDEYDVPLNKAYLGGYYDDMIRLIRAMFERVLKINKFLEFSVVTGCLRVSKESIFTGMNNISVWSREDNFKHEYFGFTENEVKELLAYYSLSDVLDIARSWYDGYLFGKEHVYCPWDIMKYVGKCRKGESTRPVNYWTDSSSNDILVRMLQESDAAIQKDYLRLLAGGTVQKTISESLTYRDLNDPGDNIWSILVATGYLTVESYVDENVSQHGEVRKSKSSDNDYGADDDNDDNGEGDYSYDDDSALFPNNSGILCELKIPNGEVKNLFGALLSKWVQNTFRSDPNVISAFCNAFAMSDPATVEKNLKQILYDAMSARDMAAADQQKEYYYHGTVLGLLYSKWRVRSNIQSGDGFCDLGFFVNRKLAIVIEMKFDSKDLDAAAQEALNQIEVKRYTDEFFRDGAIKVLRYGIACYKDACKVLLDIKTSV